MGGFKYLATVCLHYTIITLDCRCSITILRSGFASNCSGPTFFLLSGKTSNPAYSAKFLMKHGAAKHSLVIMTPNAFLTDEAWQEIVPHLIKGLRHIIRVRASTLGIDADTADRLLIVLTFDGFKCHVKNYAELINMADSNILALVENRDSSEINQAFDRFVARAGKRRAEICLDQFRRYDLHAYYDKVNVCCMYTMMYNMLLACYDVL